MENIFIDTSVFVQEHFLGGANIRTLLEAGNKGVVRILLPEITEVEIGRHIQEEVTAGNGAAQIEKAQKKYLKHIPEAVEHLNALKEISDTLVEKFTTMYQDNLAKAKVVKLAMQYDTFPLNEVVKDFKEYNPPFSEKKRHEFADALVMKSLEVWCKTHGSTCTILSVDPDLIPISSPYLKYEELDKYVLKVTEQLATLKKIEYATKHAPTVLPYTSMVMAGIKQWAKEQIDNEYLICESLGLRDITGYEVGSDIEITFDTDNEIIGTYDEVFAHKITISVTLKIFVEYPDYDTAFYDREDDTYYFLDEHAEMEAEVQITVPMEYTSDMDGENLELIEINEGHDINEKHIEVLSK